MEVLQLQQLLAAHTQAAAWQTAMAPATTNSLSSSPFDMASLQVQLLLASQQQNLPPTYNNTMSSASSLAKPQRASSLTLPSDRQPFRDLHAQVYGITPPQMPVHSKPSSATSSRSVSSSGGRWAVASDQRDVMIAEQLALIKNLNETISKQKQAAVEQDAVRAAMEAQINDLRQQLVAANGSVSDDGSGHDSLIAPEAHVAYYKEHAEQWSSRSTVDRQQLVQVLRTLIASNKRYQQPLPPMCVKPECRCRNCWFLHAEIDETAWAAAWELHMSLR